MYSNKIEHVIKTTVTTYKITQHNLVHNQYNHNLNTSLIGPPVGLAVWAAYDFLEMFLDTNIK